jgi:hypothetical protein
MDSVLRRGCDHRRLGVARAVARVREVQQHLKTTNREQAL